MINIQVSPRTRRLWSDCRAISLALAAAGKHPGKQSPGSQNRDWCFAFVALRKKLMAAAVKAGLDAPTILADARARELSKGKNQPPKPTPGPMPDIHRRAVVERITPGKTPDLYGE